VSDWDFSGTKASDDGSDQNPEWIGLYSNPSRPRARTIMDTDSTSTPLTDHPAVLTFRNDGVSTADLVSFVESFASLRSSRISGIGAREYSGRGNQRFEKYTLEDTVRELVEELADASNYIDFLAIKILSLVKVTKDSGIDCD
jgi:hypothetical protein